ncbi:MAG: nucleotidyltransferase family protein [Bacteroidota bacterium]
MSSTISPIGTLVLAAGQAKRMGFPKQLLEWRGETLVHRMARIALALKVGPVVLVTGAYANEVETSVNDLPLPLAHNPNWQSGMSSSIQTGLHHLLTHQPNLQHLLILLVDQPFVDQAILTAMLHQYAQERPTLLASQYGQSLGVPAIFSSSLFPHLQQLAGEKGAKRILLAHTDAIFPFPKAAIDLDTPEEWEAFLNELRDQ